jgi:hypothetical protein
MELGVHNMTDAVKHFWTDHLAFDDTWSILGLDAILLIPVIFAVFFYPVPILIGAGAAVAMVGIYYLLLRAVRRHHVRT